MTRTSPTSHAVLGLLAIRPWSPYELIKHMRESTIHFVWPRAESKLYEEPKRLVEQGLAVAAPAGGGRRTVYEISDAGHAELRRWLDEPSGAVRIESEALLQVLFADHGTKEQLLATLRAIAETTAADFVDVLAPVVEQHAAGNAPYPERAHVSALVGAFVGQVTMAIVEWARWAEAEVASWPSTQPNAKSARFARDVAAEWLARLKNRMIARDAPARRARS